MATSITASPRSFSSSAANTWSANQTFADDTKLLFGGDGDSAIYNNGTDTFLDLRAAGGSGDLMIALAGSFPSPDANAVHIWAGTAGVVNADGAARLIIEDNAQAVLQFLVPANTNAGIYVGSPAGAYKGAIYYNNTSASPGDTWRFVTAAAERLLYSAGAFAFQEATTISTTASTLTLNPTTEVIVSAAIGMGVVSDPSGVSNHAHVYVKDDPAEVYVRDEGGNVTKISPHNEQGEWEFYSYNSETGKSF